LGVLQVTQTHLVERLMAELASQRLADGDGAAADGSLAGLRIAILVEEVFGLTLSDQELGLDLTDGPTLRGLLDGLGTVR
jgi:hypothetical protein